MAIERATYKDYVIEHIYEALQESRYTSGDKVTESHIAEELGISRAPIREALSELVSAGLLVYKPQIGNFVASMSPREIIDAYEVRGVLEGGAVGMALDAFSEEEFFELEQMCSQMEKYARSNQRKRLIEVGREFHQKIYGRCDNIQIVQLTDQLSMKLHLLFYKHWAKVYNPELIGKRHTEIIEVIKSKNSRDVEQVIRNHYIETGRKVADLIATENEKS